MENGDYREFFSTLANYSRMSIVQLLRRQVATVTQIADNLGYEQSRVSHSLARLQRAGIVACRWEQKRKTFYIVDEIAPLLLEIETYLQQRRSKLPANAVASRPWNGGGNWATATD